MKRNACILAALAISAVLTIPAGALEYGKGNFMPVEKWAIVQ